MGRVGRRLSAHGTWVVPLNEVGAMEGSEQRGDMP